MRNPLKILLYIYFCCTIFSCSSPEIKDESSSTSSYEKVDNNNDYKNSATELHHEEPENESNSGTYSDNTYTADIEYYNPNTGRKSYYTLDVDVVNNIVVKIYFPNGGWIDETHIVSGGELDDDGTTTIYTDKGYEYTVTVKQ